MEQKWQKEFFEKLMEPGYYTSAQFAERLGISSSGISRLKQYIPGRKYITSSTGLQRRKVILWPIDECEEYIRNRSNTRNVRSVGNAALLLRERMELPEINQVFKAWNQLSRRRAHETDLHFWR